MSRLQRSFAAARVPNAKKESTFWVAPFLNNVMTALLELSKDNLATIGADEVWSDLIVTKTTC
jgi:hypothetical protein